MYLPSASLLLRYAEEEASISIKPSQRILEGGAARRSVLAAAHIRLTGRAGFHGPRVL
jgi:hypothetical protein